MKRSFSTLLSLVFIAFLCLAIATTLANPCYTTEGEIGNCTSVRSCYPQVKLPKLSNLKSWSTASLRGTCHYLENGKQVYGVCCPLKNNEWRTSNNDAVVVDSLHVINPQIDPEAERIMVDRMSNKFSCGAGPFQTLNSKEQKILGGTEATMNSLPFEAPLFASGRALCVGTLITYDFILTAAHCVDDFFSKTPLDVSRLTVQLGKPVSKPNSGAQVTRKVRRVTRHKGFNSKTLYNDIAILTLESPVFFSSTISPVCLPPAGSNDQYTDKDAVVIGWGALKERSQQPTALQQVTVQIMNNQKCKNDYGSDAPGGIVDHMLCATYPGKDSCSGNSGGPLLVQSSPGSPWIQAGIFSRGIGCGQPKSTGVYTRVTSYLDWIRKNTRKNTV